MAFDGSIYRWDTSALIYTGSTPTIRASLKLTLEEAVTGGIDLSYANIVTEQTIVDGTNTYNELYGADLRNCRLSHAKFKPLDSTHGQNFTNIDFTGINTDLSYVEFDSCIFNTSKNLYGTTQYVNFNSANLSHSLFTDCDMTVALNYTDVRYVIIKSSSGNNKLEDCYVNEAIFNHTEILNMQLINFSPVNLRADNQGTTPTIKNCRFDGSVFYKICLINGNSTNNILIENSSFIGCDFSPSGVDKTKQRLFSNCDMDTVSFSGANFEDSPLRTPDDSLPHVTDNPFSRSTFTNINFTDANLSGIKVKNSTFIDCDFTDAKLKQTYFNFHNNNDIYTDTNTYLHKCDFSKSIIEETCFDESSLSGSNLSNQDLSYKVKPSIFNINFTGDIQPLNNNVFDECILINTKLSNNSFTNSSFVNANMTGSNLMGSFLYGAKFDITILRNANLNKVKFYNCSKINKTDFTGAILTNAEFSLIKQDGSTVYGYPGLNYCDFSNANMTGAILAGITSYGVTANGVNLSDADLSMTKFLKTGDVASSFNRCYFSNTNFKSAILKDVNCEYSQFSNCNLSSTTLTDDNFKRSQFINCDFKNAKLSGSKFIESTLSESTFTQLNNIAGADFTKAIMKSVIIDNTFTPYLITLNGVNFTDVDFRSITSFYGLPTLGSPLIKPTSLSGCNLTNTKFKGKDLSYCKLQSTILKGADFSDCIFYKTDFNNSSFVGVKIDKAKFNSSILTDCDFTALVLDNDFSSANLSGCDLSKTNLGNSNFTGARLDGSKFTPISISGAYVSIAENDYIPTYKEVIDSSGSTIINKANFKGAYIENTNLRKLNFMGITDGNFYGVHLSGSDLVGSYLSYVKLSGSDLSECNLTGIAITGANFKDCTLNLIDMTEAIINNCVFDGSKMIGATLQSADVSNQSSFKDVVISGSDLSHSKIQHSYFNKAKMMYSDMRYGKFTSNNFSDADMTRVKTYSAEFVHPILERATFSFIEVQKLNLLEGS